MTRVSVVRDETKQRHTIFWFCHLVTSRVRLIVKRIYVFANERRQTENSNKILFPTSRHIKILILWPLKANIKVWRQVTWAQYQEDQDAHCTSPYASRPTGNNETMRTFLSFLLKKSNGKKTPTDMWPGMVLVEVIGSKLHPSYEWAVRYMNILIWLKWWMTGMQPHFCAIQWFVQTKAATTTKRLKGLPIRSISKEWINVIPGRLRMDGLLSCHQKRETMQIMPTPSLVICIKLFKQ